MKKQVYEDYWKFTMAYTNIYGDKFKESLRIIVDFINLHKITEENFTSELYQSLQDELMKVNKVTDTSVRKIINSYVKIGFINHRLAGYHLDVPQFLLANTKEKKQIIFSKIFYENASFNRTVTVASSKKEVNFIIKTLAYSGPLSRDDRVAMMLANIDEQTKGFLTRDEIENKKIFAKSIKFENRKYNQRDHLSNFLSKLSDLYMKNNVLYINEEDIPNDIMELEKRDPYLHRLYKSNLKLESKEIYNKEICYMEKLDYPSLVASHIKPLKICIEEHKISEAYDYNNGLLLSRGMDALFDKGYISFDYNGTIIISNRLSKEVKEHLKKYSIDVKILNSERLKYLKYNRENVFK